MPLTRTTREADAAGSSGSAAAAAAAAAAPGSRAARALAGRPSCQRSSRSCRMRFLSDVSRFFFVARSNAAAPGARAPALAVAPSPSRGLPWRAAPPSSAPFALVADGLLFDGSGGAASFPFFFLPDVISRSKSVTGADGLGALPALAAGAGAGAGAAALAAAGLDVAPAALAPLAAAGAAAVTGGAFAGAAAGTPHAPRPGPRFTGRIPGVAGAGEAAGANAGAAGAGAGAAASSRVWLGVGPENAPCSSENAVPPSADRVWSTHGWVGGPIGRAGGRAAGGLAAAPLASLGFAS